MTNYIKADIRRILHKNTFLTAVGIFLALYAGMVFIYFNPSFTADMYVAKITSYLSYFPLIVGLFVFMSVREEKKVVAKSLGEALKENRVRCQMTQEFVAETLGVSRQSVSKWENGTSDPNTSNLIALAKLYGISAEELLKNVENN